MPVEDKYLLQIPPATLAKTEDQVASQVAQGIARGQKKSQYPKWLKGKKAVASYLSVSTDTVTKMMELGLQVYHIAAAPNINFFNTEEVDAFILAEK